MVEVEIDPIEEIKRLWVKDLVENFRMAETVIRDSDVRDLLAQVKEENFPQEEFPVVDIILSSSLGLTSQELEEIANSVTKSPYRKPNLRCWLGLQWGGKDGRWRSIIINVDSCPEALVITGQEVKRLEKEEWQKEGVIFETLMAAIQKPTVSCDRLSRDDSY